MALQAKSGNPPSNSISAGQIIAEFGPNHPISGNSSGSQFSIGKYRFVGASQSNYPQQIGGLNFASIDGSPNTGTGQIPTGNNTIRFSDFYGTQLHTVVNFWSSGAGGNRLNAKGRYNNNGMIGSNNEVAVVGGFRSRPTNTNGTSVHIHINQNIGSEKSNVQHCALRTGGWNTGTNLFVQVGSSGRISGAGGNGGNGSVNSGNGFAGSNGTAALGVQYHPTQVNVASGGFIVGGFGGGGGGGGGFDYDKRSSRTASGCGGGGGAGIPAGSGGQEGTGGTEGGPGQAGNATTLGEGGSGSNNGNEAFGGVGGDGGMVGNPADSGNGGSGGEGSTSQGGAAGGAGAAIRRNTFPDGTPFTVNVNNQGTVAGSTNQTGVL